MVRVVTKYRSLPNDRAGMSLVELLVSMVIFAMISAVVIGFLTGSRRT
jgi:prepilin-type N-terminal cleavage/methylation domain-containing protein